VPDLPPRASRVRLTSGRASDGPGAGGRADHVELLGAEVGRNAEEQAQHAAAAQLEEENEREAEEEAADDDPETFAALAEYEALVAEAEAAEAEAAAVAMQAAAARALAAEACARANASLNEGTPAASPAAGAPAAASPAASPASNPFARFMKLGAAEAEGAPATPATTPAANPAPTLEAKAAAKVLKAEKVAAKRAENLAKEKAKLAKQAEKARLSRASKAAAAAAARPAKKPALKNSSAGGDVGGGSAGGEDVAAAGDMERVAARRTRVRAKEAGKAENGRLARPSSTDAANPARKRSDSASRAGTGGTKASSAKRAVGVTTEQAAEAVVKAEAKAAAKQAAGKAAAAKKAASFDAAKARLDQSSRNSSAVAPKLARRRRDSLLPASYLGSKGSAVMKTDPGCPFTPERVKSGASSRKSSAAQPAKVSKEPKPAPPPRAPDPVHRTAMLALYGAENPEKVSEVDSILTKYVGREEEIWKRMEFKYGAEAVAKARAEGATTPAAKGPAKQAVKKKAAPKVAASLAAAAVPPDPEPTSPLSGSEEMRMDGAEGPFTKAEFFDVYGGYKEWDAAAPGAKVADDTSTEDAVALEKDEAVTADEHREEAAKATKATKVAAAVYEAPEDFRAAMTALYEAENPTKVAEVSTLLSKYAGKEPELWKRLVKKHGESAAAAALAKAQPKARGGGCAAAGVEYASIGTPL